MEFQEALFSSTLPPYVLDAVSSNLAILKSPTVLRLENGDLWGWEGCFPDAGCCHGSCTHVWNYAQAFPHLYPRAERTLRELELGRSMDENGHVTFRSALPEGPVKHSFHAASDGQLGGIMKVYRDWQISGDTDWLKKMYPLAKRSLDYYSVPGTPPQGASLRAPQYLRHRILGTGRHVHQHLPGALGLHLKMARRFRQAGRRPFYEDLAKRWRSLPGRAAVQRGILQNKR